MAICMRDLVKLLVVVVLWAICYPLITTGLETYPPLHFAMLRCLLAGACLLIAGLMLNKSIIPERRTWPALIIVSITFTTLGFAGMFLAGGRVTPGLATVIANIQPLLAAVIGYFVLTERLTWKTGLSIFIGFVGIVVIAQPFLSESSSSSTPVGMGLVFVGAIGVAIGNVVLKYIANVVEPLVAMAWILLLGAAPLSIATSIYESEATILWSMISIINLLVLSVFGTALAFLWWLDLLRRVDLNVLNMYTFLTPVVAMVIGIVFYNERLLFFEWIGVFIIMLSVILASSTKPVTTYFSRNS